MEKRVVLLSGMDSLISWRYLGSYDTCLYVDLGHAYAKKERESLIFLSISRDIKLILEKCDWGRWERTDSYIPFRNAVLCFIAANLGYDEIVFTSQKGELDLYDRSPEFMELVSLMLSKETGRAIRVWTPFRDMTKQSMVSWYIDQGYPIEDLLLSPGCYSNSEKFYCSECPCCFRKAIALEANNIDISQYMPNIWEWKGIPMYVKKLKEGKYDPDRTKETIEVLKVHGLW